jgi:hypothetical protein
MSQADDRESLIRLGDVPSLPELPTRRKGRRLAPQTVYRWSSPGVRGVRLQTVRVGGVRCTTRTWLWDFFRSLGGEELPAAQGAKGSDSAHTRAESELDALGV